MKKTRLKYLLPIFNVYFALSLTLSSCSKDSDNLDSRGYYMNFTIDGETISFKETTGYSLASGNGYFYIINGGDGDSAFTINLGDGSPLEANKIYEPTRINGAPEAYISYSFPGSGIYGYSSWLPSLGQSETLPCTIKILEVTDDNIKGVFSGEMRNRETSDKVKVDQGEFNVKRTILGENP